MCLSPDTTEWGREPWIIRREVRHHMSQKCGWPPMRSNDINDIKLWMPLYPVPFPYIKQFLAVSCCLFRLLALWIKHNLDIQFLSSHWPWWIQETWPQVFWLQDESITICEELTLKTLINKKQSYILKQYLWYFGMNWDMIESNQLTCTNATVLPMVKIAIFKNQLSSQIMGPFCPS